ncbi:Microtubule-associated protein, microtubule dynamics during spindle orientation [Myotisia sp. PD_48]|nr:Microtubule-associated protein, microtubule dynamics during spindle orientation [Myotisia sp. PD_48]
MAEQEDFSALPLPERFAHKNWKVRRDGYADATKEFEKTAHDSAPIFRPFLQDAGLWKGVVADTNVAAQQDGLIVYCAFLKYAGIEACTRTRSITVGPIIEKGLSSTRPAAKSSALEALLLLIELDKPAPVIEDLVSTLSHKQPKIIAAALSALTSIFHAYGCKTIDAKPVLKNLAKVFGHADKNVRTEAQNLTVELYRWQKEAMKKLFWGDLKPVQQQDLEKLFEKVNEEPPPVPERLTRAQQAGIDEEVADEESEDEEATAKAALALVQAVDVSKKIPSGLQESLASSKWKIRKDALDDLFTAVNVPKIKDIPMDEIVRALAKCMKDANVAVVTVAANSIDAIAKGLQKAFGKYRSTVMAPIMERLKEKKQIVADALGQALDSVFASTSLTECLEDILEFTKHKNPQVKQETVKFLIRCLRTTRDVPAKPETKSIAEAATKLLTESSEVLRSAGCEVLGTLMKIMGERAMNPYLDGLDEIRKNKIKEFFNTAEVKAKDRPKPIVGSPKTVAPPVVKKTVVKKVAGGIKKPSTAPTPAAEPTEAAPPTPSKPAAKGIPSKFGGTKASGLATPGSRLKMQKLAGPGGAAVPQLSSPQRRVVSPTLDETVTIPPPPPKFGIGRGLAGRPIGKPSTLAPEPVAAPAVPTGMAAMERAELEELRLEKERLIKLTEDLRAERSKLHSEINELQNQNAQLIEDHTRDVLSIKAKETQIVRARSDAETSEQTVQKQQREIERLKRELSRAMRAGAASPPASISDFGLHLGISDPSSAPLFQDGGDYGSNGPAPRASMHMGTRFDGSRPRSLVLSPSEEEKENNGMMSPGLNSTAFSSRRKFSPPVSASSGRGSPARRTRTPVGGSDGMAPIEPAENWKRAAEVTSQLKARIEQMKARQGLSRPPPSH